MVFVLDNNGFAYSTPAHLEYGVTHLAERAAAYGFPGVVVDGTDVVAVYRAAQEAIERARGGGGPTLLELVTLRMEGHAVHDDAFYVPPELLAAWRERDPSRCCARACWRPAATFDEAADEALLQRGRRARSTSPWSSRSRARGPIRRRSPTASTAERPARARERADGGPDYDDSSEGPVAVKNVPRGHLRRSARGDAPRRARARDRRGRRRLRRRVQGHQGLPGGVRRVARDRRAAGRDRDRRRLHGRGDDGPAPGRRDAVRRLHLVLLGPPRHDRGQAALAHRARRSRSSCAARPAAASRAARSTRRTPSRRSRTSRASRSSARRRPRTPRAC